MSNTIISSVTFRNPLQQGFQRDLTCITAGFNLQETICQFNNNGSPVYIEFLDCKEAYDSVWRGEKAL